MLIDFKVRRGKKMGEFTKVRPYKRRLPRRIRRGRKLWVRGSDGKMHRVR